MAFSKTKYALTQFNKQLNKPSPVGARHIFLTFQ